MSGYVSPYQHKKARVVHNRNKQEIHILRLCKYGTKTEKNRKKHAILIIQKNAKKFMTLTSYTKISQVKILPMTVADKQIGHHVYDVPRAW